jgi:formylglycine-generating enzyme required for sulfatase activity
MTKQSMSMALFVLGVVAAAIFTATASVDNYEVGEEFKDCDDCPTMVVIPAGSFMMGSPLNEEGRFDAESPQHRVTIRYSFLVGKFEVTFDEWDACVSAGGCNGLGPASEGGDNGWGRGNRPVINVSWDDTKSYISWLSDKMGKTYRLLSEAEWEYAARAGTTTRFRWGDNIGSDWANCIGCGSQWDNNKTAPVGSFSVNAFGLYDMHGNVWEWVEDCYNENYDGAPNDESARLSAVGGCDLRVERGGSWSETPRFMRSAFRLYGFTVDRRDNLGFRVARSLD